MAFSFGIGANCCHDFPKLARESGFHFNMQKSKVHHRWSRLRNIDINQIIRERDFWTVDENINNVIDYCLESEYDVKILDPDFVKLFRLAQLAVEYLLYCKQYLDHSVIILKDELKSKIEENLKLKKQNSALEETIVQLKERIKEKNRLMETRITDSSGEIHKCPHCAKTFVSAMFLSAHIARRHRYNSGLEFSSSPIHENYRAETEKLHNEIKALKERLNQTERVIRNDSIKLSDEVKLNSEENLSGQGSKAVCPMSDSDKAERRSKPGIYEEEIISLRNMFFDEIKNLQQREQSVYEHASDVSVQALITQQEKEFQKLRNQLLGSLTPGIEDMQAQLRSQEHHWKLKLESMESRHSKDMEKLIAEFKRAQEMADRAKADYESKISELEQQASIQSNMLLEQSNQLHTLLYELKCSQNKPSINQGSLSKSSRGKKKNGIGEALRSKELNVTEVDSMSSSESERGLTPLIPSNWMSEREVLPTENTISLKNSQNMIHSKMTKEAGLVSRPSQASDLSQQRMQAKNGNERFDLLHNSSNSVSPAELYNQRKLRIASGITNNNERQDVESSDAKSESLTSRSDTDPESESVITVKNESGHRNVIISTPLARHLSTDHGVIRRKLEETFDQKLKDLGIDPDWQGIPNATFKQKMDFIRHHGKISMKKLPGYNQIKYKIIEELRSKLSEKAWRRNERKSVMQHLTKNRPVSKLISERRLHSTEAIVDLYQNSESKSEIPTVRKSRTELYSSERRRERSTTVSDYVDKRNSFAEVNESSTEKSNGAISLKKRFEAGNLDKKENDLYKVVSVAPAVENRQTSSPVTVRPFLFESVESSENSASKSNDDTLAIFRTSPKSNKSVLKSASGFTNSLVKKKVIFDLKSENDKDSESGTEAEVKKEELPNIVSILEGRHHLGIEENEQSVRNIKVKRSQGSKIAEISRKIEDQLNSITRHQPVGSVETIFPSKQSEGKLDKDVEVRHMSTYDDIDSFVKGQQSRNPVGANNSLPQPAPRNIKESQLKLMSYDTDDIDLDSDIDEILRTK